MLKVFFIYGLCNFYSPLTSPTSPYVAPVVSPANSPPPPPHQTTKENIMQGRQQMRMEYKCYQICICGKSRLWESEKYTMLSCHPIIPSSCHPVAMPLVFVCHCNFLPQVNRHLLSSTVISNSLATFHPYNARGVC